MNPPSLFHRLSMTLGVAWCVLATQSTGLAQTVAFPDPNLEACVRETLGIPENPITVENMLTLTSLDASGRNITDTAGLETARNLTNLVFNSNPVTNYSGIAGLTNLTRLDFIFGSINNLSFMTGLTKLQTAVLYNNQIENLSPLAGRTNLLTLSLGWNGVTNPAVLATLTGLHELYLNGNNLTNVTFLAGLTNLTGLDLAYTALADISPVTNLTRLVWLNVGENSLSSLPDLSPLASLLTFMMAGNQITDLTPVTRLPVVSQLHLQRNPFQDLSPLTNCPYLYILLFYDNNAITNLPVLGAIPNLEVLQLEAMQITNLTQIDFLATLPGLWQLDLYQNHITDLSLLTNYPGLHWLGLAENRLQQIDPLLNMPGLGYVNLRENYLDTGDASPAWNVITNLQGRGVTVEYDSQSMPPVAPRILVQPANRSAFPGNNVTFSVTVETAEFSPGFRWQKDGVDLEKDAQFSGVDSDTLEIANITDADAGLYRVRVWREWVVTNSTTAELKVITSVSFADPNLEQAVRDALEVFEEPLTPEMLAGLYSLDASYRDITNLSGLEAAANLVGLNLSGNQFIADFTPLTFLASLNDLAVNDAGLDNINWAADLRTLNALQVNANLIEDLSPLRPLVNLVSFSATENELTDIDPLLDLAALTGEVQLSWNRLDTNETSAAWNVITNLQDRGATVEYDPQNAAPIRPVITTQPVNVAAFSGDGISFNVVATGAGTGLNYRWQKNGVNLNDADRIGGTAGDTLWIDNVEPGDAGSYRVRVWDEFGVAHSRMVTLRVVTSVAFVDPNLERAVRDWLGIPTTPLTPADLARMDGLDARDYGITNLSGIESAANLNWIILSYNPGIAGYTPLTALPYLVYLDLNACGVSSIGFVANLPLLNELHAWGGNITDISPLAGQTRLTRLNLAYSSGITNFIILTNLTGLEGLWLEGTGIPDISFAALMPNLREFSFESGAVHDLSPLAGATNLVSLDMANNQITNAAPLAGCTNLEWLSASGNQIPDLDFATDLTRLWFLAVNNNAVEDISGITDLTNLTVLDVGWNPVTDLAPIGSLAGLTELHLWNLGLSNNLGFLAPLTNLERLDAGMNQISTLPPYPNLNRLRYLNLEQNPLAYINFVSSMTNLEELVLNDTGIRDLSPLAGCTNLHNLALAGNGITDISPLATLRFLNWVTLWDNNLRNISALSALTNLAYVDLRHNVLDVFGSNPTLAVIQDLQSRGTMLGYDPQQAGAIFLVSPDRFSPAQFRFTLHSAPNSVLEIWGSSDLETWWPAGVMTNATGADSYTDDTGVQSQIFYRAGLQQ